jgi:hypothetical protein
MIEDWEGMESLLGETSFIGQSSDSRGLFHADKLKNAFTNLCSIETTFSAENGEEIGRS